MTSKNVQQSTENKQWWEELEDEPNDENKPPDTNQQKNSAENIDGNLDSDEADEESIPI